MTVRTWPETRSGRRPHAGVQPNPALLLALRGDAVVADPECVPRAYHGVSSFPNRCRAPEGFFGTSCYRANTRSYCNGIIKKRPGRYCPDWNLSGLAQADTVSLGDWFGKPRMKMYLSKSDFKVARTCPTKLYYKKLRYPSARDENHYMAFLADGGYMVETIAKLCFPEGVEIGFENGPEASAAVTKAALEAQSVVLFEATLISNGKIARVDILRKRGNIFELIEVKAKSVDTKESSDPFRTNRGNLVNEWVPYLEDVTFQVSVLRELYPDAEITAKLCVADKAKTTDIDLVFSNFELVHPDDPKGFNRPIVRYNGDINRLRENHFLSFLSVDAEVSELMAEVMESSSIFANSLKDGMTKMPGTLGVACRGCEYRALSAAGEAVPEKDGFRECWKDLADPSPHILDYFQVGTIGGRGGAFVNALINRGRVRMDDVAENDLVKKDGTVGAINARQLMQRRYTLSNTEFVDEGLPGILRNLAQPLRFIDFETSRIAVPYHAGMRPYEQVAFQWSCHTVADGESPMRHSEWMNITDAFPNFEFARSLMEEIGEDGTLLTWSHHERSALADIRRQMEAYGYSDPELARWLDEVVQGRGGGVTRIVDMCELAKTNYFHPKMKGSLSLKYVLPAVWEAATTLHTDPRFSKYYRRTGAGILVNPYDTLPALPFGDKPGDDDGDAAVTEGTGAMRAYQEMLYGLSNHDEATKDRWRRLLLQYCELDTAAMVIVWLHWSKQ